MNVFSQFWTGNSGRRSRITFHKFTKVNFSDTVIGSFEKRSFLKIFSYLARIRPVQTSKSPLCRIAYSRKNR